jgi:hypothetical protein
VVPRQVFGCSGIVLVLELELVVGGSGFWNDARHE